jgi:hypothetical protein
MRLIRSLIPASAIVVLTVGLVGPAAAAAAPEVPSAKPTAASCATPLGVTVDADGDQHHRFQLTPSLIEDHVVPAAGFNPLTASDERLKKYGLPPRPAAGDPDAALWSAAAAAVAKPRTPKPGCRQSDVRAIIHNSNYSGYMGTAASGKTYSGAHSSYTAPSYYLSTCSSESMTQWVGVSDDANLVQAGVYVNQFFGTLRSGGFYEIVGGTWDTGGLIDVSVSVPYVEGHRYYFNVRYVDRFSWAFLVNDLTNGKLFSINIFHPEGGGTQYRRPLGYFTSERLSVRDENGDWFLTQYLNHSAVRFRTATVQITGEGEARLSIQRPEQVIAHSPGIDGPRIGNLDPIEVSPSNFTENWARCGQVEALL